MKKIGKFLYSIIPFKFFFLTLLRLFWIPSNKIRNFLRFDGVVKIEIDNDTYFKMHSRGYSIETEYFWLGKANNWEKESIKIWKKLCTQNLFVLDIGSNTGIYSLIAKTVNPLSTVYAFEPQPNVHKSLLDNNRINHMNINCEQIALSNNVGKVEFYNYGRNAFLGNTTAGSLNKSHRPLEQSSILVNTETLSSFIERNNIKNIDLMKLDVEAHEVEVIEGMGVYLSQFEPKILIEIIDDKIGEKLQNIFSKLNYKFYFIDEVLGIYPVKNLRKREFTNYLLTPNEVEI